MGLVLCGAWWPSLPSGEEQQPCAENLTAWHSVRVTPWFLHHMSVVAHGPPTARSSTPHCPEAVSRHPVPPSVFVRPRLCSPHCQAASTFWKVMRMSL